MRIHVLSLTLLAAAAQAADGGLDFGGYRLELGAHPGVTKAESSGASASLSGEYGPEVRVGAFWDSSLHGGWGFAIAPSLYFRQVTGKDDPSDTKATSQSYGLRLGIGPSYSTGNFTAQLLPYVGLGADTVKVEAAGFSDTSNTGITLDYGLIAEGTWLLGDAWYVGGYAGYQAFRSDVKFSGSNSSVTYSGGGLGGGLAFGYRPDDWDTGGHDYSDDPLERPGTRVPFYFGGVRVAGGIVPGIESQKANGTTVDLDAKTGGNVRAGIFWDTSMDGGFGLAVEPTVYFRETWGSTGTGPTLLRHQLKSFGLRLGIGPAMTVGPVVFELMPFGGIGSAWDRVEAGGVFRDSSGSAAIFDYGIDANAFYMFRSNLYLGGYVGYEAFTTDVKYNPSTVKVTLSGQGLAAGAMIGLWF